MKLIHCTQGSEEWHQARAGVITASTFALAISMSGCLDDKQQAFVDAMKTGVTEAEAMVIAGYKTKPRAEGITRALAGLPVGEPSAASEALAASTAIELISGQPYGDTYETFAMKRGAEQEAFARMRYEERFGVIVDEAGLVVTDDHLFGYSTDGFVNDDGMIEIKVPLNASKVLHIIRTGDVSEYIHQIQGGLWITGRKYCDFVMGIPDLASLNNGNELYVKRIHRDEAFIEKLELDLWAFAGRVKAIEKMLRAPFTIPADAANDASGAAAKEAA